MSKYYRIDKTRMDGSIETQIQRGLDTFSCKPQDNAIFRIWCFLLVNDELTPIARMKYTSTLTALKWLVDMEWIIVDDESRVIILL